MMKTVSILGCGWLGMQLGVALVKAGFRVRGSTTSENKVSLINDKGIEPFLVKLSPSLEGERVDEFFSSSVIVVTIPPRRKQHGERMFLEQVREIVRQVQTQGAGYVIFISSTSVYPDLNRVVYETDADAQSYMRKAEELWHGLQERTTILRFAGLVGPGRHPGRFLAGREVSGEHHPVNIIHSDDCVSIIMKVIENERWGEVFNACADVHPEKGVFYSAAAKHLGLSQPVFRESDGIGFKIIDNTKLKEALAYEFKYADPMTMKY